MAYSKRPMKRRSHPKRPMLAVRTASKKVAVARRSSVVKLQRSVRQLQVAKYGAPQKQRQSFRSTVGGGATFTCSTNEPVTFCLEAISQGNEVYSTQVDGLGNYDALGIGSWIQQEFPPTALNAANAKYDLQLNSNSKSLGVRSTYLYRGQSIDIQMFAQGVNGYLHCYEIHPRASVTRAVDQERKLPFAIPSFVHMGGGGDSVYDQSNQFFSIKKRFTRYFNTVAGGGTNRLLQTNNLAYKRLWCGGKSLITGTDVAGINLVRDQDIPTRKQHWLLFTFTDNNPAAPGIQMRIQLQRTVHFSDSEGSK